MDKVEDTEMKLAYIIQCVALAAMVAHADEAAIAPKCLYSVSETSQETKVKPEKARAQARNIRA